MINYTTLALPIIAVLAIGGIISFFVVYSFYPEKHENIKIDGKCYELVDAAHEKITELNAEMKIKTMLLQISKVDPPNARIPIIFNGKDSEVNNLINTYNLTVTSNQKVMYFPNINGSVVTADITKPDLLKIVEHLSLFDVFPSSKSVVGSIGIQPNKYISPSEEKNVSLEQDKLMKNKLRQIIDTSEGVESAECRNDT
ncbi:MAG: hypothetical protein QOB17_05155 [Nitrososphaeraceae archaeon]|nr:hypothetical protein [Nitrososphaeraceae archaeon]MDW0249087.1 hypothetical protein [Nitrososphaeraceae archaeon]